jgi:Transcriptional regulatory protein, C terminal
MRLLLIEDGSEEGVTSALTLAGYEVRALGPEELAGLNAEGVVDAGGALGVRYAWPGDRSQWPSWSGISLDPLRGGARVGERFVELTRTEYRLLALLMLHPRRVLPRKLIYERVWGYDFGGASNALRVYVGYLRRKLAAANAPVTIRTVRGVGYGLREAAPAEVGGRQAA